ncbi:MAG: hypothetical protein LAT63_11390 [Marinobacter sp.]|nr:hypothetical protein [Marinobacter sp.]
MPLILVFALLLVVFGLFRFGVIVLDRQVFGFQINPILRRGKIRNIREYKIMHNYIEMLFERDPELFNQSPDTAKLNSLMNAYHIENS